MNVGSGIVMTSYYMPCSMPHLPDQDCSTYILLLGVSTVLRNGVLKSMLPEARMANSEWGVAST